MTPLQYEGSAERDRPVESDVALLQWRTVPSHPFWLTVVLVPGIPLMLIVLLVAVLSNRQTSPPPAHGPRSPDWWRPMAAEMRERLQAMADTELVDALNREVGNKGWVSARGVYLMVLREVLVSRVDCTAVDGLAHAPGKRRFALIENRLVYADEGRKRRRKPAPTNRGSTGSP
jgi:hypothetical protein